jgi:hypothetical protein
METTAAKTATNHFYRSRPCFQAGCVTSHQTCIDAALFWIVELHTILKYSVLKFSSALYINDTFTLKCISLLWLGLTTILLYSTWGVTIRFVCLFLIRKPIVRCLFTSISKISKLVQSIQKSCILVLRCSFTQYKSDIYVLNFSLKMSKSVVSCPNQQSSKNSNTDTRICNLYPELSFVPHIYLCQCLKIGKFILLIIFFHA